MQEELTGYLSLSISSALVPPTNMSTTAGQIIEHVVLFKVKTNTDPFKVNEMVNGLNSLTSLHQVLYLTAGPIINFHSSSPLTFTHILHVRFRSKEDLASYTSHPSHLTVVLQSKPIVQDIMAVDWLDDHKPDPEPGSVMRVAFLKQRVGKGKETGEVLGIIREMKDQHPAIDQVSVGEIFSPERAKGYSIGTILVLPAASASMTLDSDLGFEKKFGEVIESLVVLDHVIPSAAESQSAGLQ